MVGKMFITRTDYDPQLGRHVKDPYLGPEPTLGACRPDLRRQLSEGDHIFVVSGKVRGVHQFVMGGFEIKSKMNAIEAHAQFPQHRLRRRSDGQLTGNIIVNSHGEQHELDDHETFSSRINNYLVGTNPIILEDSYEVFQGRERTLDALRQILGKGGDSPFQVVGRWGTSLSELQVIIDRLPFSRLSRHTRA